jgi:glycosyltransferase involved in cell wall biosynthesis
MTKQVPVVSVCLITYNHVAYIKQAIEGVLMQQVNVPLELIIADDYSTDGTREILVEYQTKHPDMITLILQPKNVGAFQNWMDLLKAPQSKYIAYFEGDDYWTDSLKLQKQIDFLESHPDYVLCFHPVQLIDAKGNLKPDHMIKVPAHSEHIETLAVHGNYIHTPSIVFRNIIQTFPPEMEHSPIGDYYLYMLLAKHGKLKSLPDVMAVYRLHDVGVHSLLSQTQKSYKWFLMLYYLIPQFDGKIRSILIHNLFDNVKRLLQNAGSLSVDMKQTIQRCAFEYDPDYLIRILQENQLLTNRFQSTKSVFRQLLTLFKRRLSNN